MTYIAKMKWYNKSKYALFFFIYYVNETFHMENVYAKNELSIANDA